MECKYPNFSKNTYELEGCMKNNSVGMFCEALEGVECEPPRNFTKYVHCYYTNGKRHNIALLLSFFLGWTGVDRIYLGYVSLGLLKFFSFSYLGVGWLYDLCMIATDQLRPVDGSYYIKGYFFGFWRMDFEHGRRDKTLTYFG